MDQVSDIVALPPIDDSGVQEGVISSKRKRDDTLNRLYEFDATQTYALSPIEQGLQTMDKWLTDMEGLFHAGVKDINFLPSQWDVLTFRSDIRTELFPKVYLNPNDLWVKEQEQLNGKMITAATFQTLEGKKLKTIEENVAENIKYHAYDNGLLIKEYVVNETVFYEVVSKVEYKEEAVTVDKPKENKFLDSLQLGLDLVGLIPVVGEVADGANGLIYTARGDMLNAGLSFSAMIPVVGMASTGGKLVVKASKGIENAQDASKVSENIKSGARYGDRRISDVDYNILRRKTPSRKIQKQVNENIDKIIGTADPALPGKTITGTLQADHIVPMDKITRMEGFDTLTKEQQIEVLNYKDNFIGLSEAANKSKGSKSYSEWTTYKKENIEVDSNFRTKMIEKEKQLEIDIQNQIDEIE